MKTPAEIRFELDRTLLSLASDGGRVPLIVDIHSIVCCEGNTVSIGFDIVPEDNSPLFFEFEKPREVHRAELAELGRWLAFSGHGETIH